jgi:hypothetical protein
MSQRLYHCRVPTEWSPCQLPIPTREGVRDVARSRFSWRTGVPTAWSGLLHKSASRLRFRPDGGRQREIHSLSDANYLARAPYLLTNMGAYVLLQGGGTSSLATAENRHAAQAIESLSGLISPEVFALPIAIHGAGGVMETALAVNAVVKSARQAAGTKTREQQRHCLLEARGRMDRAFLSQDQPAPGADKNNTERLADAAQDYWSRQQAMTNTLQASQNLAEQVIDAFRHAIVSWTARIFTVLKFALHATPWIGQVVACLGVAGAALQAVAGMLKWHSARKLVHAARQALAQWDAPRPATAPITVASGKMSLEHALCRRAREARCKRLKEAKAKRRRARVDTAAGITTLTFLALSLAFPPLAIVAYQVMLLYVVYRVIEAVTTAMDRRRSAQAKPAGWPDAEAVVQMAVQELSRNDLPWLRPLLARCGKSEAEIEALFQLVQMGKLATAHKVLGNMVDGV